MSRPPLYSRTGNISPTVGGIMGTTIIGPSGKEVVGSAGEAVSASNIAMMAENNGADTSFTDGTLLDKAQQFSVFAVRHVEEVRQALICTADDSDSANPMIIDGNNKVVGDNNNFGGKNGAEISLAFEELTAVYDKLSSLKWDAARMEFEEKHRSRAQSGMTTMPTTKYSSKQSPIGRSKAVVVDEKADKQVKILNGTKTANPVASKGRGGGLKDDPWQDDDDNDDDNDMNPQDWISDAFLKAAMSDEDDLIIDEGGQTFPINNGHLASLNATAEPYTAPTTATTSSSMPPGFQSELLTPEQEEDGQDGLNEAPASEELQAAAAVDDSAMTNNNKPAMQSLTSISSEISSLHTTSHPCTDDDGEYDDDDSDESEYSDDTDSSSSEEEDLPSLDNFDYIYKGGYAMQVSGGKETKGVVPKTVKRVLVDPSVKSIEEGAFQGCNLLVSITIPSSVEAVGDHAFRKCSKLRNVIFLTKPPKSRRRRTKTSSWKGGRDEKKEETMQQQQQSLRRSASAPSSITEPRSSKLRSIGEWAFFNCSSLMAVKLPYGLVSIGTRAFQRCSSMSIAELPKTLTSVGENAFVGCPRETKVAFERWEKEQSN